MDVMSLYYPGFGVAIYSYKHKKQGVEDPVNGIGLMYAWIFLDRLPVLME
jgi:hypothetical protein